MYDEWIQPYESTLGTLVRLPGSNSCYFDPTFALDMAFKNSQQQQKAVLFVIACHNFLSPYGFQMCDEAYTAYPHEGEYLLMEGCQVHVLTVEREFKLHNVGKVFEKFRDRTVTVIHLFHHSY